MSIGHRDKQDRRSVPPRSAALGANAQAGVTLRFGQVQPNVLFMLVDNLGYGELGVCGGTTHGAPAPRIDRLASDGLRLTNMNRSGAEDDRRLRSQREAPSAHRDRHA